MQVEINNKDSVQLPAIGHVIFGTDESCDYVFALDDDTTTQLFSIIQDKVACILEVFNNHELFVNKRPVTKAAILHPGDIISIKQQQLKLVNENALPQVCKTSFKINKSTDAQELLITSVSGLRSFNPNNSGELVIIGNQNSFIHKPLSADDVAFTVSFIDDCLTLLCQKDKYIEINGNKASYVVLKNGDFITTKAAKYCVESPGTSSFSKYSPSHPRNIQLSEEYSVDKNNNTKVNNSFLKNNTWWITLVLGLIVIAAILLLLKNLS